MSSWYKVAVGLQIVAMEGAKFASSDVGRVSVAAGQHAAELISKALAKSNELSQSSHISSHQFSVQQQAPLDTQRIPSHAGSAHMVENSTSEAQYEAVSSKNQSTQMDSNMDRTIIQTENKILPLEKRTNESNNESASSKDQPNLTDSNTDESIIIQTENKILPPRQSMEEVELLKEGRSVPSTRVGRAVGFAQLGLGLVVGTATEGLSRMFGGQGSGSIVVNDSNSDRLAATLCRMRGAALKMGQMLSIQDESLLPPALSRALQQVRQGAEAMPKRQLFGQLEAQLGKDWRSRFETFEEAPFAAASIGQVHRATVKDRSTGAIRHVVVKVQYPGVARSIESDLNNLSMLVSMTGLAPKGLFIENVIRVGQEELKVECDYLQEVENQKRIKKLVESDPELVRNKFMVPDVLEWLSTNEVIASEYIPGGTIDKVSNLDQDERNRIGKSILYLTMKELFEWRFMQTDPNWGNFIYDYGTGTTGLIDFGAARDYNKEFVDGYLRIVWASANRDEKQLMQQSRKMGFLTGDENEQMLHAHKMSGFTVGEPFWEEEPFDFKGSKISTRMGEHTAVFLRHRLTPPPEEVYTLHRKLAGAYMLCIKLGAVVESRSILKDFVAKHKFEDGLPHPMES